MAKVAVPIALSVVERRELESLARAHKTGQAMARRARIVLGAAAGLENKAICVEVGADATASSREAWNANSAASASPSGALVAGSVSITCARRRASKHSSGRSPDSAVTDA